MNRDDVIVKITFGDLVDYVTSDYMRRTSIGMVSDVEVQEIAEQVHAANSRVDIAEVILDAMVEYTAIKKLANKCATCDDRADCDSYNAVTEPESSHFPFSLN